MWGRTRRGVLNTKGPGLATLLPCSPVGLVTVAEEIMGSCLTKGPVCPRSGRTETGWDGVGRNSEKDLTLIRSWDAPKVHEGQFGTCMTDGTPFNTEKNRESENSENGGRVSGRCVIGFPKDHITTFHTRDLLHTRLGQTIKNGRPTESQNLREFGVEK